VLAGLREPALGPFAAQPPEPDAARSTEPAELRGARAAWRRTGAAMADPTEAHDVGGVQAQLRALTQLSSQLLASDEDGP
jgi:hypothetical protein